MGGGEGGGVRGEYFQCGGGCFSGESSILIDMELQQQSFLEESPFGPYLGSKGNRPAIDQKGGVLFAYLRLSEGNSGMSEVGDPLPFWGRPPYLGPASFTATGQTAHGPVSSLVRSEFSACQLLNARILFFHPAGR